VGSDSNNGVRHQRVLSPRSSMMMMMIRLCVCIHFLCMPYVLLLLRASGDYIACVDVHSSSSRRLESAAAAASERDHSSTRSAVRRKDASDETQLWSSMQSLADDEDLIDSLSRSAAAAPPSARLVPPAQFRRPTPPSVCPYDSLYHVISVSRQESGGNCTPSP